ncbi:Crotonobetainyl-CoA:carnitine CoA-transferase CaiB [Nocardioides sp. YR527]|uniref:CoA transferase n=1 Tax=Nocardioides sp. YR527 TaxID=1881028 RepID=UPI000891A077|nr:CoA transferase [Nocardioides sp. YR527]SDK65511.1 Crotonobetainyl-CoA:carnitine CoA-transferase CaiB [Nocardioides sp. YR527]
MAAELLLTGVRVADLGDAVGEAAARLLADLGAETLKLEPPQGARTRTEEPVVDGHSLPYCVRNANKSALVADLATPEGRADARALVAEADIVFVSPTTADAIGLAQLRETRPGLVAVISSPFGLTGPRRDWQATGRTLLALGGAMSRSGRPGAPPLVPPEQLATATATTQAAWLAIVAHTQRTRTGLGQTIDLSHHEAVATGLDPAFGVQGSAAAGRSGKFRRGRPPADSYPIYRCADGFVRLCLLAKRQWRGMFGWLGEPAEFADPSYDSITARVAASDRLEPLIEALFADRTAAELVDEAARRGIPLAQVLSLGEALAADHFTKAGTVSRTEVAPGLTATVPVGYLAADGHLLGLRTPSPGLPTQTASAGAWAPREGPVHPVPATSGAPFAGLRVLDLGVIVFGAEAGRAFADLGAEVIKVESRSYPDGLRQTRNGEAMNASFAWGNRGKRSLGLDLRTEEGKRIFIELARRSDVVLSNFKPGTLDSLGIGFTTLAATNPGIIVLESSAFSAEGPWAQRLGYGPLVRAACGVTSLWKYAAGDTASWDGVTVFPDHVAARLGALSVAAALLARSRDGRGRHLQMAQSDVVLHQLADLALLESLRPGSASAVGNRGREVFGGVFACAGDDEWCVIDARDPAEVELLREAVAAGEQDLADAVSAWTAVRSPAEVGEELQRRGLPAAPMLRLPELLDDPQLAHRGTYTTLSHPLLEQTLPAEDAASAYERLEVPTLGPAPLAGADTESICRDLLGLDEDDLADLLDREVVFVP